MCKWKEDFLSFLNNRIYVLMLSLTAVFSYGFMITHQTIGIDDTPYMYYFEDGLNVIVGRWFLYVLNKVFHVAEFSPFITELAGVLILMVAVTVWCTLIYSVCGKRIPMWGYTFFACIFLSCPLISEVYTYYLHNGVSVGYLSVGLSLCFMKEFVDGISGRGKVDKVLVRRLLGIGVAAAFFLFVAMGCYESFMIVWLVGFLALLFLERCERLTVKVFKSLVPGAIVAAIAIVMRSVMMHMCIVIFDLSALEDEAVQRSVAGMLGWMTQEGALAEFAMAIKRMYVMYFAFMHAYLPIKIFVFASLLLVVFAVWKTFRQKDLWIGVLAIGIFVAAFLLVVIEGKATLYRAAQFLPLICGLGALMPAYMVESLKMRRVVYGVLSKVSIFILCAILWNQCFDINQWFYVDWMKYEVAKDTMSQVAKELQAHYDTSKPVVFTGSYMPPEGVIGRAYASYGSEEYYKIKRLTDLLDKDLLDKFNRGSYGVWVAQTPALSVIDWGFAAFENDAELVHFCEMHGYDLMANMDNALYEELQVKTANFPRFPQEGSIMDMGEYIVVHF